MGVACCNAIIAIIAVIAGQADMGKSGRKKTHSSQQNLCKARSPGLSDGVRFVQI